jgi:hypothetical protein
MFDGAIKKKTICCECPCIKILEWIIYKNYKNSTSKYNKESFNIHLLHLNLTHLVSLFRNT